MIIFNEAQYSKVLSKPVGGPLMHGMLYANFFVSFLKGISFKNSSRLLICCCSFTSDVNKSCVMATRAAFISSSENFIYTLQAIM